MKSKRLQLWRICLTWWTNIILVKEVCPWTNGLEEFSVNGSKIPHRTSFAPKTRRPKSQCVRSIWKCDGRDSGKVKSHGSIPPCLTASNVERVDWPANRKHFSICSNIFQTCSQLVAARKKWKTAGEHLAFLLSLGVLKAHDLHGLSDLSGPCTIGIGSDAGQEGEVEWAVWELPKFIKLRSRSGFSFWKNNARICPICFYTVFRHAACCSFPPMALCQDEEPVPGVPFAREARYGEMWRGDSKDLLSNLLWELGVLGSIRVWHGP